MKRLGIDITSYSIDRNNFIIKKLLSINSQLFGAILTQLGCLKYAKHYDCIYVGYDMHLLPLALAKALGICKKPIFVLSHFTYNSHYTRNFLKKLYKRIERFFVFKYIDCISFASERLLLVASGGGKIDERQKNVAYWGASLDFFNKNIYKEKTTNNYFVAAGGMNRDYATLVQAFEKCPELNLKVFAVYKDYTKNIDIPDNVQFINLMEGNNLNKAYKLLRNYYYNCIAILLPIDYINDVPNGATVLVEALAMGKPIVITDAETNYIDVEKGECGIVVNSHDVNGWINAIRYLKSHPHEANEMGQKSYRLAIEKYNDTNFVKTIYGQIKQMINK